MINRSNPVWQSVYGAAFCQQYIEWLKDGDGAFAYPESHRVVQWKGVAEKIADESLGEPEAQPVSPVQPQPQTRDESKDVWLPAYVLNEAIAKADSRIGRILPGRNTSYSRLGFQRYVPYAQLEEKQRVIENCHAEILKLRVELFNERGDSKLLDAILEAYGEPDDVARAVKNAIAERAKR